MRTTLTNIQWWNWLIYWNVVWSSSLLLLLLLLLRYASKQIKRKGRGICYILFFLVASCHPPIARDPCAMHHVSVVSWNEWTEPKQVTVLSGSPFFIGSVARSLYSYSYSSFLMAYRFVYQSYNWFILSVSSTRLEPALLGIWRMGKTIALRSSHNFTYWKLRLPAFIAAEWSARGPRDDGEKSN